MKKPNFTGLAEHQIIPFPCHLSWEDLELNESGDKHCAECDCEVRDLTDLSSDEIYALQDQLGGKLCGKIYKKNNYVVTEIKGDTGQITDEEVTKKSTLTIPSIISGGIAALSIASCSTSDTSEEKNSRNEAQAFPDDGNTKPVNETKQIENPPCLLGIIALPPKN